jgi:four helix bundle protein
MPTGFDDLVLLKQAELLCDEIWELTAHWGSFARETVGGQLVRAADSIGANMAESYGRYSYGEKIQFLYYSRGSLYETKYWLNRASHRGLVPATDAARIAQELEKLARGINAFVGNLKRQRASGHA